jgi:hypothetical protein
MYHEEERLPGRKEIEKLLAFLPILTAEGFTPVLKDFSLEKKDGVLSPSYPVYHNEVNRFMSAIGRGCWRDVHYPTYPNNELLRSEDGVEKADLAHIRALLTFMSRGERFCDGFTGGMFEGGHVVRVLRRLEVLHQGMTEVDD